MPKLFHAAAQAAGSVIESLETRRLLAQTIAVDLNTPLQTIRAIGANVARGARSTDPNASPTDEVSNFLLDSFDIGMMRVAINIKTWEPVNDNNDPNVIRPQGFPDFGFNKTNFELIREYANRGVKIVASVFDLPNWMVSNPESVKKRDLKPGFELEVAESIAWWLKYLKTQYGVTIDTLSMNEGNGGYNVRWNQVIFSNWLNQAMPYFQQQGLGYVKWLVGDDGVGTLGAHTKPLLENPQIRPYLSHVAYHSWSYRFINDADLAKWSTEASKYGKEVWVTEFGTSAEPDQSDFNTWSRTKDTALAYWRALTVTRASTVLWWQFGKDFPLVNSFNVPKQPYYVVKPFHDHVKPGAQMVKVSPNNTGALRTLATKDLANNKFFAQIYNSASPGTASQSITLTGLPNTSMTITQTREGDLGRVIGTFTPVAGKLSFNSPADSIIVVAGKMTNTPGPLSPPVATIASPTGAFQYSAGGQINFSGDATDADEGTLAASKFNWTITPVREGIVGTPVRFSGVKSGTFAVPANFQRAIDQQYIIELKVTDSTGLTNIKTVEINPKIINVTVNSNIPGIAPGLNGYWESRTTPISMVAGVQNLFASSPQFVNGRIYKFGGWSNGGAQTQSVTANSDATFTASYVEVNDGSAGQFFGASHDTYVRDGDGLTTNYGQATELQAKISDDPGKTRYSYFRFDIGSVTANTAKLRLFGKLSGNGERVPTNIYGVSANWDENTITFSNRPQFSGTPIVSQTAADTVGRWYEYDVSSYVNAARQAGATSVAFAVAQASNSSPYFGTNSGEASENQPQLYINSSGDPPPPPPPPPPTGAAIRGTVFLDQDLDGVFDSGEAGVAGRTVYLDNDNDSVLDANEVSTTTNATGQYEFANLAAGAYKIRQVLPSGFVQTTPANNFGNNATVSGTQVAAGEDFGTAEGTTPPPPSGATIRGTVFLDQDRDGTFDSGEAGVSGRTIYLDTDNDSVLDASEASTTTNAGGQYDFANLAAGNYKIRQVLPSGFLQTSPANNFGNNATVSGTQVATGEDFGTAPITNPTINEIGPVADSYIRDSNASTNYGSGTELAVQSGVSGVNRRGYIKFDISSLSSSFTSVILKLSGRLSGTIADGISVGVFAAPDAWTEAGLTWNNRPRENSTPIGSVRVRDTTRRTYELDLTQYIRDQKLAGRQFVTLVLKNLKNTDTVQSVFTARELSTGSGARLSVS